MGERQTTPAYCATAGAQRSPGHGVRQQGFRGAEQDILGAEFGAIVPEFKEKEYDPKLPEGMPEEENAPPGVKYNQPGFKVQQVNLKTGETKYFIYNKNNLPASVKGTGGLERPLQPEWGKEGSLYMVDFGVVDGTGMNAMPFAGVLWKVSKGT